MTTYTHHTPAAQQRLPIPTAIVRQGDDHAVEQLRTGLDAIAAERQLAKIDRASSLALVEAAFTAELEPTRRQIARTSNSLLHVLEVFSADRSPSVRAACAHNRNAIDRRIQLRLAADPSPLVVLSLIDGSPLGWDAAEWLVTNSPFELVRYELAQRRLERSLLRTLPSDQSPLVANAARNRLSESRTLRSAA